MNRQKTQILIVEDEVEITRALRRGLTAYGYDVHIAHTGEEGLQVIDQRPLDVILLDLGLPRMSGLEICKQVRSRSETLPIIVISVRNKERDKVEALDLGADDYIAKPFGMSEVLARVRVALRHTAHTHQKLESSLTIGPLHIDFEQHLVTINGQEVQLTPTEYDLLKIFVEHRGKIVTQQMLLSQVWKTDQKKRSYLHVYVGHLRRKIEPDPAHPHFLHTISGVGYRFRDDEE